MKDKHENGFLIDYLKSDTEVTKNTNFWIGLKKNKNEYSWTDGTQLEFGKTTGEDPWKNGEPDEVCYE